MTYEIFREGKMSSIHLKSLSNCLLSESCCKQLHAFTRQVCLLLDLLPWILAALNEGLFADTFPLITKKKSCVCVLSNESNEAIIGQSCPFFFLSTHVISSLRSLEKPRCNWKNNIREGVRRSQMLDPQATKFLAVAPNIFSLFITGCPLHIKKRKSASVHQAESAR